MRIAADTLSSAPAMQIRYLEAMQAMAKSGNSKVIFMPGPTNSGDFGIPRVAEEAAIQQQNGEGSSGTHNPYTVDPVQNMVNTRVIESM